MSNISISNVEFTFSIPERFQELLNEGYSPKVVGIGVKLDSPLKPLSDAFMDVRFYETGALFRLPLINHSWEAHFALFTYLSSPQEAFQEIVWGKEGVAVLNDVKYNVPNRTEAK